MTDQCDRSTAPEGDDADIPGTEILYRRLSYYGGDWVLRDPISGKRIRPISGGFDPDTDGVSVFRQTVLLGLDPSLGPEAVTVRPDDIVAGFSVADVRALSLGVKNDPWPQDVPDPDHPRYAAHALITGLDGLGKNPRKRLQKQLTELPSMNFVLG